MQDLPNAPAWRTLAETPEGPRWSMGINMVLVAIAGLLFFVWQISSRRPVIIHHWNR